MARFPEKLQEKLSRREVRTSLRHLPAEPRDTGLVDFSSNDYLGLSRNLQIFERASQLLTESKGSYNGATGSRLLSGNYRLYGQLEDKLAHFHQTDAALVFNSGYDANIGFFGCVPQRGDIVFYDEYVHASIRDGIKMGNAKSYKFRHNDLRDLEKRCQKLGSTRDNGNGSGKLSKSEILASGPPNRPDVVAETASSKLSQRQVGPAEVYVVTESVFSMDGDSPDLKALSEFCRSNAYHLIVDEAHAVGVFGKNGQGLVQHFGLEDAVFARIVTFGKAFGCHGAAVLGNEMLKAYLVNFARSLIYTTGLPPHSIATILSVYELLEMSGKEKGVTQKQRLEERIRFFNLELETHVLSAVEGLNLKPFSIPSESAIHCCIISGNERVRLVAEKIRAGGFDVRAILSPTVPKGKERLRICLHSYNTKDEIQKLLALLSREVGHSR